MNPFYSIRLVTDPCCGRFKEGRPYSTETVLPLRVIDEVARGLLCAQVAGAKQASISTLSSAMGGVFIHPPQKKVFGHRTNVASAKRGGSLGWHGHLGRAACAEGTLTDCGGSTPPLILALGAIQRRRRAAAVQGAFSTLKRIFCYFAVNLATASRVPH